MTKKEQARMEELLTASALRSTSPVVPDIPIPNGIEKKDASSGFIPIAASGDFPRIEEAHSTSSFHCIGSISSCWSQKPVELYSTRLLALMALRYEAEKGCAQKLRRIDRMIEAEQEKESK